MANLQIPIPETFNDELKAMLKSIAFEVIQEVANQSIKAKDWMSIKEVQAYMNVSPNTIKSWVRMGLPISEVGQKRYISKKNLDSFLERYEKIN